MEVRLIGSIWDWVCEMAEKSTERVREWRKMNQERTKELNRQAALRYIEKNKDDPEFIEHRKQLNRESMRRTYAKKRAEMTPEELEEYRRKTRERVARIRAAKKAAAQQANESEKDRN